MFTRALQLLLWSITGGAFICLFAGTAFAGSISICTAADLQLVRNNLDSSFIQTCDIELNNQPFEPIGNSTSFTGSYNGNGFVIRGLNVTGTENYKGLFGHTLNANLTNITIEDASISGSSYVAILAGRAVNTTFSNCAVSGDVVASTWGGGIVGRFTDSSMVFSSADVTIIGGGNVGGLIGALNGTASYVADSYAVSDVSGTHSVAGLIGHVQEGVLERTYAITNAVGNYVGGSIAHLHSVGEPLIRDSYSSGTVHGLNKGSFTPVGGFVAFRHGSHIENCYTDAIVTGEGSSMGGLTGTHGGGSTTNSYYSLAGFASSTSGTGLTEDELAQQASYLDWDFTNTWMINETLMRPTLRSIPEAIACTPDIDEDGVVALSDLFSVILDWGPCPAQGLCSSDVNENGAVEFGDIFMIISWWGACP